MVDVYNILLFIEPIDDAEFSCSNSLAAVPFPDPMPNVRLIYWVLFQLQKDVFDSLSGVLGKALEIFGSVPMND